MLRELKKNTFSVDFKPKSLACEKETFIAFGGNGDVQVVCFSLNF